MKGFLPMRLFLFILISLFTVNAFSQAIPDPGNDPVEPLDSIAQTINSIPATTGQKEVLNVPSPYVPIKKRPNCQGIIDTQKLDKF
jgi:hypothetical protein